MNKIILILSPVFFITVYLASVFLFPYFPVALFLITTGYMFYEMPKL